MRLKAGKPCETGPGQDPCTSADDDSQPAPPRESTGGSRPDFNLLERFDTPDNQGEYYCKDKNEVSSKGNPRKRWCLSHNTCRPDAEYALRDELRQLGSLGKVPGRAPPGVSGIHAGEVQESGRQLDQRIYRQCALSFTDEATAIVFGRFAGCRRQRDQALVTFHANRPW